MDTNRQILFFFSLLGAFNGIILALYFIFFAREKKRSDVFLGLLLLVVSIRIGKSVFFYFNHNLSSVYIHIGIMACTLIGPLLYLFVRSESVRDRKVKWYDALHLLPLLVIVVIAIRTSYWEHRDLWRSLVELIYWQWFVYLIVAGFVLIPVFKSFGAKKEKGDSSSIWLVSVFVGISIIWLAYKTSRYTSYIVGAVSFSFVFYVSGLLIYRFSKIKREELESKKNAKQNLDEEFVTDLERQIQLLLERDDFYKNPNLKMPDLASKLNTTPHLLSQYLNESLNKNFSQFINEHRVEEAVKLLSSSSKLTVEAIAYDSGFNSVSAFYTAFKNKKGMTPAAFKKQSANLV